MVDCPRAPEPAPSSMGETEVCQVVAQCKKSARALLKTWKNWQVCRSDAELEKPMTYLHIVRGYREKNRSWDYYVKSIFFPNNQAMNVWTHFVPFLCFLYRLFSFIQRTDDPLHIINFPYYVHGLGVCLLLLTSSLAHTFCCKSLLFSQSCFAADFAAIYNYGLSFMVALESYVCPISHYCGGPSPFVYFMKMAIATGGVALITFYSNSLKCGVASVLRTILYSTGTFIIYSPCIVRFCWGSSADVNQPASTLGNHHGYLFFIQFVLLAIATVFYVTRYPEATHAGMFDIFGNSHNWFHIFSALSMYSQSLMLEGALEELKIGLQRGEYSAYDLGISWGTTLFPTLFTLALLSGVAYAYAYVMYRTKKCKSE